MTECSVKRLRKSRREKGPAQQREDNRRLIFTGVIDCMDRTRIKRVNLRGQMVGEEKRKKDTRRQYVTGPE